MEPTGINRGDMAPIPELPFDNPIPDPTEKTLHPDLQARLYQRRTETLARIRARQERAQHAQEEHLRYIADRPTEDDIRARLTESQQQFHIRDMEEIGIAITGPIEGMRAVTFILTKGDSDYNIIGTYTALKRPDGKIDIRRLR